MARLERWVVAGYGWLALAMPAMMLLVVAQAVGRVADLGDVSWVEDVCRLILLWGGLLFVPRLQLKDEHIAANIFRPSTPRGARVVLVIQQGAFLVLGAAFVYAGSVNVVRERDMVGAGGMELPLAYFNSVIPICGLLVCAVAALRLWRGVGQGR